MPEETQEGPAPFSGLQLTQPKPGDFLFGGETGILNNPRNDSGDWRSAEPTPKTQLMKTSAGRICADTNACTCFSATNNLAVQLDWLIAHGQIDPNGLTFLKNNGYIDSAGKVNISPRFTAVMSKTTPSRGNTLPNVWDSIRNNGVVPETAFPMPTDLIDKTAAGSPNPPGDYWNDYYTQPPQSVLDLGKQFRKWFNVQYEWIAWQGVEKNMEQLAAALTVAPLQVCTAVCTGWNTADPIGACGDGSAHATTLMNVEVGSAYDIMDHYNPFMKRLAADYSISYAVRGVIASAVQNPTPMPVFTCNYTVNLVAGMPASQLVHDLQQGLQTALDNNGLPYLKRGVFGPFGPQTMIALARFQVDHGIADVPQGHDFGPNSRAALTRVLNELAFEASGQPKPKGDEVTI